MESVFVAENPIDINLFVSECTEAQKLKIGEIFQLADSSLSMCCINCSQEFQYFTEFSLHIQDHFWNDEITQLKDVKEESEVASVRDSQPSVKRETAGYNDSEYFDTTLGMMDVWSDDNQRSIFEPEINVESIEKPRETTSFIEGIDYEKVNGTYRCSTCNHESAAWKHFKEHLSIHSNERNFLCPICSKAFSAVSYVRKHVNRTHKLKITADKIREAQPSFHTANHTSTNKPAPESKSFIEGEDYEKWNGRFRCLTCGRETLDHIREHLMTHSNEKNILCPICQKPFIAVSYVRKHVNRAHKQKITANEIRTAQLSFDVRTRPQSNNPMVLSTVEKEKYFECFECHKQFTSLSSLRIHQKLHSGIMYSCPQCDKVFAMKSYVRDHLVIMHNVRREEIPKENIQQALVNTIPKKLDKKPSQTTSVPFLCVICGTVYKSSANLRYHMERHEADACNERHACNECGKTYPTRRYMLSHHRTMHRRKNVQNNLNLLIAS